MRASILLLVASVATGGARDFDKYNLITGPRLLAVRAEPPTTEPDGTTTLDALVQVPADATVEYAWSWCPLRGGAAQDYNCLVSEPDLRALLAANGVDLAMGYDLGADATATLGYPAPAPALAALCGGMTGSLPPDVTPPDCTRGFPVSVGLTVRAGGAEIRSYKEVRLALDENTPRNHNPSVSGVGFGAKNAARAATTPVVDSDPPVLQPNTTYELWADVPESSAEPFVRTFDAETGVPQASLETLTLTWFVEAGETLSMRTSYIYQELTFDDLDRNQWKIPRVADLETDHSRLTLVIRDERGGVAWLARDFALSR